MIQYLNQNIEKRDVPSANLLREQDNPAEVCAPRLWNGQWAVMFFEKGQPYPSNEVFNSFDEAQFWASQEAKRLGVEISA